MSRLTWLCALLIVRVELNWKARVARESVLVGEGNEARRAWRLLAGVEPVASRSSRIVASSVAVRDNGRLPRAVAMLELSAVRALPTAWSKAARWAEGSVVPGGSRIVRTSPE